MLYGATLRFDTLWFGAWISLVNLCDDSKVNTEVRSAESLCYILSTTN